MGFLTSRFKAENCVLSCGVIGFWVLGCGILSCGVPGIEVIGYGVLGCYSRLWVSRLWGSWIPGFTCGVLGFQVIDFGV